MFLFGLDFLVCFSEHCSIMVMFRPYNVVVICILKMTESSWVDPYSAILACIAGDTSPSCRLSLHAIVVDSNQEATRAPLRNCTIGGLKAVAPAADYSFRQLWLRVWSRRRARGAGTSKRR